MSVTPSELISSPLARTMKSAAERALDIAAPIILISISLSLPLIYRTAKTGLDDAGWIRHSHDTPVWIGEDWLAGEYRVCVMQLMPRNTLPSSAHLICGANYAAEDQAWPVDFINSISEHGFYGLMGSRWDAVEPYFHVLHVIYWGRIDRGDRVSFSWRCQRLENKLECKAMN